MSGFSTGWQLVMGLITIAAYIVGFVAGYVARASQEKDNG